MGTRSFAQKSLHLQDRDIEVLRGLYESRIYTLSHIAALYFSGHREYAKKRVRQLKAGGFIAEWRRQPTQPAILHLTRTGCEWLTGCGYFAGFPTLKSVRFESRARVSAITLAHALAVLDCKAAIVPAINAVPGLSVAEFSTWPVKYQFKARHPSWKSVTVKPDGFIRLCQQISDGRAEHRFFLEVDRSTEAQDVLNAKAACYLDYYRSGNFAASMGRNPAEFRRYPLRVAIVFRTAERRDNCARQLLAQKPPIRTLAWLTTMEDVVTNPIGPIWLTPADYAHGGYRRPFLDF